MLTVLDYWYIHCVYVITQLIFSRNNMHMNTIWSLGQSGLSYLRSLDSQCTGRRKSKDTVKHGTLFT